MEWNGIQWNCNRNGICSRLQGPMPLSLRLTHTFLEKMTKKIVVQVGRPSLLCSRRQNVEVDDMSLLELQAELDSRGWECQSRAQISGKVRRVPPFDPDQGGPKIWFTSSNNMVAREYLILLLCATELGVKKVYHFQCKSYYWFLYQHPDSHWLLPHQTGQYYKLNMRRLRQGSKVPDLRETTRASANPMFVSGDDAIDLQEITDGDARGRGRGRASRGRGRGRGPRGKRATSKDDAGGISVVSSASSDAESHGHGRDHDLLDLDLEDDNEDWESQDDGDDASDDYNDGGGDDNAGPQVASKPCPTSDAVMVSSGSEAEAEMKFISGPEPNPSPLKRRKMSKILDDDADAVDSADRCLHETLGDDAVASDIIVSTCDGRIAPVAAVADSDLEDYVPTSPLPDTPDDAVVAAAIPEAVAVRDVAVPEAVAVAVPDVAAAVVAPTFQPVAHTKGHETICRVVLPVLLGLLKEDKWKDRPSRDVVREALDRCLD